MAPDAGLEMQGVKTEGSTESRMEKTAAMVIGVASPRLAQIGAGVKSAVTLVFMLVMMLMATAWFEYYSSVRDTKALMDRMVAENMASKLSYATGLCESNTTAPYVVPKLLALSSPVRFGEAPLNGKWCHVPSDAGAVTSLHSTWPQMIGTNGDPPSLDTLLSSVWEPLLRERPRFVQLHGNISPSLFWIDEQGSNSSQTSGAWLQLLSSDEINACARRCAFEIPHCDTFHYHVDGKVCAFAKRATEGNVYLMLGRENKWYTLDRNWSTKRRCSVSPQGTPGISPLQLAYGNVSRYAGRTGWHRMNVSFSWVDNRPKECKYKYRRDPSVNAYGLFDCHDCVGFRQQHPNVCAPCNDKGLDIQYNCEDFFLESSDNHSRDALTFFRNRLYDDSYDFPCAVLGSCAKYRCFDQSMVMCDEYVPCTSEIVSVKTMTRALWSQCGLAAFAQLHNYELLSVIIIAAVVLAYSKKGLRRAFAYRQQLIDVAFRKPLLSGAPRADPAPSTSELATLRDEIRELQKRLTRVEEGKTTW